MHHLPQLGAPNKRWGKQNIVQNCAWLASHGQWDSNNAVEIYKDEYQQIQKDLYVYNSNLECLYSTWLWEWPRKRHSSCWQGTTSILYLHCCSTGNLSSWVRGALREKYTFIVEEGEGPQRGRCRLGNNKHPGKKQQTNKKTPPPKSPVWHVDDPLEIIH